MFFSFIGKGTEQLDAPAGPSSSHLRQLVPSKLGHPKRRHLDNFAFATLTFSVITESVQAIPILCDPQGGWAAHLLVMCMGWKQGRIFISVESSI